MPDTTTPSTDAHADADADGPTTTQHTTYFDDLAELFAVFAADTDQLYRPWLTSVLSGGERAVDLGCGSGRWTGLLTDHYPHVLGVDVSQVEIDMARRLHPTAHFATQDLRELDPHDVGQFDLVLSVNTIHHLNDHPAGLAAVHELLAPGGQVVIVDITDPGGWSTMDYQVRDAFLDAEESYRERSKDHRVAAKVLELHLHPVWLEHCLNDTPLTRTEFHRVYGEAFPGAQFVDLHRVITAMTWRAPD